MRRAARAASAATRRGVNAGVEVVAVVVSDGGELELRARLPTMALGDGTGNEGERARERASAADKNEGGARGHSCRGARAACAQGRTWRGRRAGRGVV